MEFMNEINSKIEKIGKLQGELMATIEEAGSLIEKEIKEFMPEYELKMDEVFNYFDDSEYQPDLVSARIMRYVLDYKIKSYR